MISLPSFNYYSIDCDEEEDVRIKIIMRKAGKLSKTTDIKGEIDREREKKIRGVLVCLISI